MILICFVGEFCVMCLYMLGTPVCHTPLYMYISREDKEVSYVSSIFLESVFKPQTNKLCT